MFIIYLSAVQDASIYAILQQLSSRGGQSNVFLKSANRKSVNSWAESAIGNPQTLLINLQIANPYISTKYCTALSQNCLKSRLFKQFFIMYKFN
jgi:hypothetical protein